MKTVIVATTLLYFVVVFSGFLGALLLIIFGAKKFLDFFKRRH